MHCESPLLVQASFASRNRKLGLKNHLSILVASFADQTYHGLLRLRRMYSARKNPPNPFENGVTIGIGEK